MSLPGTQVNIINCEFMGNDSNLTSGCVFLECNDVVMSSSSFINFKDPTFTFNPKEVDSNRHYEIKIILTY